jgi:flagellar biosynthesis protein FlhA
MLSMMVLPLPPFALDLLFTFNIALALMVMMVAAHMVKPLDFAALPTGAAADHAAAPVAQRGLHPRGADGRPHRPGRGRAVIEAFGHFLIGGNFAVGLIVFAILVVINFVVVTKGAERIAEVGARFTLDAMPGKQMAIDADLNAGLIDEKEAKPPPRRSGRGGRLLRLHGRRQQVRARRRDGRHADPVHQHHRRLRIGMAMHGMTCGRRGGRQLHPAGRGRRAGGADPGAADLGGRGDGGLARGQGRGHRHADPRPGVRLAACAGRDGRRRGCCWAWCPGMPHWCS